MTRVLLKLPVNADILPFDFFSQLSYLATVDSKSAPKKAYICPASVEGLIAVKRAYSARYSLHIRCVLFVVHIHSSSAAFHRTQATDIHKFSAYASNELQTWRHQRRTCTYLISASRAKRIISMDPLSKKASRRGRC